LTNVVSGAGLTSNPYFPAVLYYSDRPGWNLPLETTGRQIDSLPGSPCSMAIFFDGPRVAPPAGWHIVSHTPQYAIATRRGCS
jgi:hypothetical protein